MVADIDKGGGFDVPSRGKADTETGTLRLKVSVEGAGTLVVAPAAGSEIRRTSTAVARAGDVTVTLRPTRAGMRELRRTGVLRVKARFTFTPCGGPGSSLVHRYTLSLK